METIQPQQIIEFNLPKRGGEPGRLVKQSLSIARIKLHPPTGRRGKLRCSPVNVTVLLAKEIKPPAGEKPIVWWLMTDIDLNKIKQPADMLRWYLLRWQIEIFFRILKSGCQVEKLQLTNPERYEPCVALYMIIAWRILLLTSLAKAKPNLICTTVFDDAEWRTAWIIGKQEKPPKKVPDLAKVVTLIAKMGGYLARKNVPLQAQKQCGWD